MQMPMFINQSGIKMIAERLVSLCSLYFMFPVAVNFYAYFSESS
jgi:hypothetical protein